MDTPYRAERPRSAAARVLGPKGGNSPDTGPHSLYDAGLATMEAGGDYNQTDAEGFLRIQGLPSRVQARLRPRKY